MKREKAKIDLSIIVPVYNHEKYIEQALTSIIEQETLYTYEILIGEDGSSDHSKDVIQKFEKENPKKIRAFYREKNIGATRNGYALYMEAQGRYVAVLEGDDYWVDKNKIQKQITFLDKYPEFIGVACNYSIIDKNGNILIRKSISDKELNKVFTWEDFLERGFVFQTATFMYRNIYLDGKDYSILYKAHELVGDLTVLTILLNQSNIFIMKDVMSVYRKVVDTKSLNACSIANRDTALATMKTVRQYIMLKPYLKNKHDFDELISMQKMNFFIQMIKRTEGYTWKRWKNLQCLGGISTNLFMPVAAFRKVIQKYSNEVKKVRKCQRKF